MCVCVCLCVSESVCVCACACVCVCVCGLLQDQGNTTCCSQTRCSVFISGCMKCSITVLLLVFPPNIYIGTHNSTSIRTHMQFRD